MTPSDPNAPQFETTPHGRANPVPENRAIRFFKVATINLGAPTGGTSKLVGANACANDGTMVGTVDYVIRTAGTHIVDDVIMATIPEGGIIETYNGNPVYWAEVAGGSVINGNLKYQVFTTMDDLGNTGWDWVKTPRDTGAMTADSPGQPLERWGEVISDAPNPVPDRPAFAPVVLARPGRLNGGASTKSPPAPSESPSRAPGPCPARPGVGNRSRSRPASV